MRKIRKILTILFLCLYSACATPIVTEVSGVSGPITKVELDSEDTSDNAREIIAGRIAELRRVHPKQVCVFQGTETTFSFQPADATNGKITATAMIQSIDEALIHSFRSLDPASSLSVLRSVERPGVAHVSDRLGSLSPKDVNEEFLERMRAGSIVYLDLGQSAAVVFAGFQFKTTLPPHAIFEILDFLKDMTKNNFTGSVDEKIDKVFRSAEKWCEDNSVNVPEVDDNNQLIMKLGEFEIVIRLPIDNEFAGKACLIRGDARRADVICVFYNPFPNIIFLLLDCLHKVAGILSRQ